MHLGNVLAGHGFDYEAVVVAGQEAVAEATLGVAVERGAPRQRVLTEKRHPDTLVRQSKKNFGSMSFIESVLYVSPGSPGHRCRTSPSGF